MKILKAEFSYSSPSLEKCKPTTLPELAFIGRSNVGKSSLINMLVQKKGLAKTSQTPGKTRLINFFTINDSWFLVDLPGYGYARISKDGKAELEKMINAYLSKRNNLVHIFVLIDIRLEPQKSDINFINNLGEARLPFSIVFTKTDKLTKNQIQQNKNCFIKELKKYWDELPDLFLTSAVDKAGREEILTYINSLMKF